VAVADRVDLIIIHRRPRHLFNNQQPHLRLLAKPTRWIYILISTEARMEKFTPTTVINLLAVLPETIEFAGIPTKNPASDPM
jgi:hypothetical protein